jgi:galactoside O-acetyltransferase
LHTFFEVSPFRFIELEGKRRVRELKHIMNSAYFLSLIQRYWKEYLLTGLFGGIPTPIGMIIRNTVYQAIFDHLGKSVHIHPNVRLFGTRMMRVGDHSRLFQSAYIKAKGAHNTITLGSYVTIDQFVTMHACGENDGTIEIGDSTYLGAHVEVNGPGSIRIGKDCLIASHCTLNAGNHNFADRSRPIRDQGMSRKGIVIEDDCWLGNGVRVLDGVTIERGCVIGAGAVVTKDIPPYSIAVGVPAKVIGQRGEETKNMPAEVYLRT